jgi:hypothetical protein
MLPQEPRAPELGFMIGCFLFALVMIALLAIGVGL